MSIPDVILLFIISGFFFYGFFFGLIRTIGAIVSLVCGALIASAAYPVFMAKFGGWEFFAAAGGKIFFYFIIFSLAYRLVNLAFMMIDRSFDLISIIPFLKSINKLSGAVFGVMLGAIVLGLFLKSAEFFPATQIFVRSWFGNSAVAPWLITIGAQALAFLPGLFGWIKSKIDAIIRALESGFHS